MHGKLSKGKGAHRARQLLGRSRKGEGFAFCLAFSCTRIFASPSIAYNEDYGELSTGRPSEPGPLVYTYGVVSFLRLQVPLW